MSAWSVIMSVRDFRHRNRVEWVGALALATLPISLTYEPTGLEESTFRYISDIGMDSQLVSVVAAIVVTIRVVCLWANGALQPWSAYGRIFCAYVTMMLWLSMSLALLNFHITTGRALSPGFLLWLAFAGGELWSMYQAARDAITRS